MTAFATAEAVIRLIYGWQQQPFRDRVTNFAILAAALLGMTLGALIGKFGSRMAVRAIAVRNTATPTTA